MAQTIENIVDPNDSALSSEMVKIGALNAYVSRPKDGKNLGTVIVIHENRGLVGHIKDVTRRFAKDGFAAIGVATELDSRADRNVSSRHRATGPRPTIPQGAWPGCCSSPRPCPRNRSNTWKASCSFVREDANCANWRCNFARCCGGGKLGSWAPG